MRISLFFLILQLLVLGTVNANFAGIVSPSHAKPAVGSTFHFSIPTADTSPSSSAVSPTSTDDAISSLKNSHLTCHTDFSMANMAGSEVFVEACSLLGKKITLLVTHLNVDMELLGYIDPTIPQQLFTLDLYAHELETEHGCRTSNQEKTHCIWLSRLRDELFQLMIKTGGPEKSLNLNLFDNGYYGIDLKALNREIQQILDEMDHILTELHASVSLNYSQRVSVFYKTVLQDNRLQKLLERAANLEKDAECPERGPPIVCIVLSELKGAVASAVERLTGEVVTDA